MKFLRAVMRHQVQTLTRPGHRNLIGYAAPTAGPAPIIAMGRGHERGYNMQTVRLLLILTAVLLVAGAETRLNETPSVLADADVVTQHAKVQAFGFDGGGTVPPFVTEESSDFSEFSETVNAFDDPNDGRTAEGEATQDTTVDFTDPLVSKVDTSGAGTASWADPEPGDGRDPSAQGRSEFTITFEVTNDGLPFSLVGSIEATAGAANATCTTVTVTSPDGTIFDVSAPASCGPGEQTIDESGELAMGTHMFSVIASAHASNPNASGGSAEASFNLSLRLGCTVPATDGDTDGDLPCPPIVFIHGFLGSRINCGTSELWPNIHLVPPSGPDFPQMLLAEDGVSTAPGACDVSVGDTLDEVLGGSIYKGAIDFLDELAPGNVSYFNWDWRTSPGPSLDDLDAFIDDIRAAHGDQKVVLVAHSYGGLLARWYVDDATHAGKVERVLTIGTPAWGSPKALFPLFAGIETPDLSGLDLFMDNEDLHEFAKNLFGSYFLYPSSSYGPWLTVHPSSTALSRQGLLDFVAQLGGNATLLDQALTVHSSTLDSFAPGGVDLEVIVGLGLPTITAINVEPDDFLLIEYGNGDGTVPATSAARGVAGPTNPNAAHTHYSCGVGHVDLPGDPQVTDAIEDFLRTGDAIQGLPSSPCPANGFQIRLFQLPSFLPPASAASLPASDTGAMSLEDAVLQGQIDYLDLPKEKFIITGSTFPEVALPEGRFLEVTPISDGTKGEPSLYGPLEGQISISSDADGPAVFVDGEPVEPDQGHPHTWGDNDCSGGGVAIGDAQKIARSLIGNSVSQTPPCPLIGADVTVDGDPGKWADVDCNGSVAIGDAQKIARSLIGLPVNQTPPCPAIGNTARIAES